MESKKQPELTTMTGMAIVMVLLIHASASYLGTFFPGMSYLQAGKLLHLFSQLISPAVPMFIFLAGFKYALRDMNTAYGTWLKKRLPRVLMSFFIINTLFWLLDSIVWMDKFDFTLLLKTYISSWMGNTVAYPLWYIPMYCCVIIACPLVGRVVRNSQTRLILYFAIGAAQHVLESYIPLAGEKPFMFLAYPLFFELGIYAFESDWRTRWNNKHILPSIYVAVLVVVTFVFPQAFAIGITEYLCEILGVMAYYVISISLRNSKPLHKIAAYAYPIFLLHEPVVGRCTGAFLRSYSDALRALYLPLWFAIVLLVTLAVVFVLKKVKLNRILWEFKL